MGGVERKGKLDGAPVALNVGVVMGGALDLREAWLPPGTIELRVAALMGGVEIIVPPNLPVEAEGVSIMGGFDHVDRARRARPGAPLLRVKGLAFMGGVHIEMRLPGDPPATRASAASASAGRQAAADSWPRALAPRRTVTACSHVVRAGESRD